MTHTHLRAIDTAAWPALASVPDGRAIARRARFAETRFARACSGAGIELAGAEAALVVEHEAMFARLAQRGWVGLAEAFMAGEWRATSSQKLVDVLVNLIGHNYRPEGIAPRRGVGAQAGVGGSHGELPPDLVSHFAGDGESAFQGHFASGAETTQRISARSRTPGAGRKGEPKRHFVDVTEIGAPVEAHREDLRDAQLRSAQRLLDAARVGAGTHLLDLPSSGGALSLAAAARGATVDTVTELGPKRTHLREYLALAGAPGAVRIDLLDGADQALWARSLAATRRGAYDAIVSAESLETMSDRDQVAFLRAAESVLAPSGRIALQTLTRTEKYSRTADAALESLRVYVWPALKYPTVEGIAAAVDRNTQLRVIARTSAPDHLVHSLRLQRTTFDTRMSQAAADGYDVVFRRMWVWQFAVREALATLGMLDLTQSVIVPRHRRGRR